MVNILSVDCDWIMEPSIEAYNARTLNNQEDTWKNILLTTPKVNYPIDARKYNRLIELLFSPQNKVEKNHIYLANSHEQIVTAIEKWQIEDNFKIYNIDHHHDCGYDNCTEENFSEYLNNLTCANWVAYLKNKDSHFIQYNWINNFNSTLIIPDLYANYIPDFSHNISMGLLENVKFDYIFICKSLSWIPPEHQPLIEGLYYVLLRYYEI